METPTEENDKFDPLEKFGKSLAPYITVEGLPFPVVVQDIIDFDVPPSNPEEIEKIVEHNAESIGRRIQLYSEKPTTLEDIGRRLTGEHDSSPAPSLPPGVYEMPGGTLIYKDGSPVIVLDSWVFPEEKAAPKIVVSDDPGEQLEETTGVSEELNTAIGK